MLQCVQSAVFAAAGGATQFYLKSALLIIQQTQGY